ncbi:MAG: signal peptide peptidase SppA [Proteobacteria bacterium]|nr:signal peptide peptidase SppA [Pseudomonadota bacterium]
MRRFIVGLLATIGFVTVVSITGAVLFLVNGPLAPKSLPDRMVLSLDLRQVPKERGSGGGVLRSLLHGDRDFTDTVQLLWQAADDPRVAGLYVEVGDDDAGLARVQELRDAIRRLRGKGKFAIGFAEELGGNGDHFADYYLASALDQIWMQPSGGFQVMGLAVESSFLRSGLDKLGVKVEGGKRWEYKSAPDTFTETGFTAPARQNLQQLIDSLYGQFIDDVARERKLPPPKLRALIDSAPFEAERALKEKLVDKLGYRADAMNEVWKRAGSTRDLVTIQEYAGDDKRPHSTSGEVIALVHATGTITSSTAGGLLDDDSVATSDDVVDALDSAARTKEVKAIVLRIDSPGGTYPAADAMADAVGRARSAGKPVVVSMGDVAASGGYLAAVRADVIVAQPTTITGSIGVFGIWPVATKMLDALGVKFERLSTGGNAGMYSPFQPPTDTQKAVINRSLDFIYADFTRQVGEARKLDPAKVDAAARGRVFSGVDAKQAGLVDELGGLQLALSIAKAKANIDEAQPIRVRHFPPESDRWQKLADRLMRLVGVDSRAPMLRAPHEIRESLARFGIASRPGNVRLPPLPPLWR